MAEAQKPDMLALILDPLKELGDAVLAADLSQHLEDRFVGATMAGPQSEAMPAAMQAKGTAPEEPASLTVDVEAFCS